MATLLLSLSLLLAALSGQMRPYVDGALTYGTGTPEPRTLDTQAP